MVDDNLHIYNSRTGKEVKPYIGSDGYMTVSRTDKNQKAKHQRVHTIYAHCFIPNPNNYKYVNHIDSNKLNNDLGNLEWCTNSYNVYHGWHSGNRPHKNKTKVVVTDLQYNFVGEYSSIRECSKALSLDRHKIARVLKKELRDNYLGYYFNYGSNR